MSNKKILTGVLLFWVFLAPVGNIMAETHAHPWPMFGHDARHTRQSQYREKGFGSLQYRIGIGDDTLTFQFPLASAAAVGYDPNRTNTLYVGAIGQLQSLGECDNCVDWIYTIDGIDPFLAMVYSSPAIGSDGTVYAGSDNAYFYALDPKSYTGNDYVLQNYKWRYRTGNAIRSSPVIASDGMIYVGSDDSYLYAFDSNGSDETRLKWRYQTDGSIQSAPAIGLDGTIYVGSDDHYLYAINPSGTRKWRYQTGNKVFSSPSVGSDGTIYVGSNDGYFYALTPNGTRKWRWRDETQPIAPIRSSPAIASDGTIYIGSDNGYLYALNPDGTQKWSVAEAGGPYSPAISSDGTIICYTGRAYNPDGSEKWSYNFQSIRFPSSPVIGADGWIYVNGQLRFQALHLTTDGVALCGRVKSMATGKPAAGVGVGVSPTIDAWFDNNPNARSSVDGYYFGTISHWENNGIYKLTVSGDGYQTIEFPSVALKMGDITDLDILVPTTGALAITRKTSIASVGQQGYEGRVWVAGGTYPYTFSSTTLPSWCTLDSATGTIKGTPTTAGSHTFTITVTDSSQDKVPVSQEYTIYVMPSGFWGDIDGDSQLNMRDVILGLRVLSRMQDAATLNTADSNGGKISLQNIIYIIQSLAGLR
jgi:outer membrane protein assembly factor BamB